MAAIAQAHNMPTRSLHVCVVRHVFLCWYRTRWRKERLRSRPSTLSCWRTCRTPSAHWRNKPSHNLPSFHLWPLHCRITFQLLVCPKPAYSPVLLLWLRERLCVCVQFHVEGKEKVVLYYKCFCCLTLDPLHGRWSCVDLMCAKEGSLPPHFFLSLFTWLSFCICVALPEEDFSVDVL